jgi:hypothetical protein
MRRMSSPMNNIIPRNFKIDLGKWKLSGRSGTSAKRQAEKHFNLLPKWQRYEYYLGNNEVVCLYELPMCNQLFSLSVSKLQENTKTPGSPWKFPAYVLISNDQISVLQCGISSATTILPEVGEDSDCMVGYVCDLLSR